MIIQIFKSSITILYSLLDAKKQFSWGTDLARRGRRNETFVYYAWKFKKSSSIYHISLTQIFVSLTWNCYTVHIYSAFPGFSTCWEWDVPVVWICWWHEKLKNQLFIWFSSFASPFFVSNVRQHSFALILCVSPHRWQWIGGWKISDILWCHYKLY
jgi:hypothetical protein